MGLLRNLPPFLVLSPGFCFCSKFYFHIWSHGKFSLFICSPLTLLVFIHRTPSGFPAILAVRHFACSNLVVLLWEALQNYLMKVSIFRACLVFLLQMGKQEFQQLVHCLSALYGIAKLEPSQSEPNPKAPFCIIQ